MSECIQIAGRGGGCEINRSGSCGLSAGLLQVLCFRFPRAKLWGSFWKAWHSLVSQRKVTGLPHRKWRNLGLAAEVSETGHWGCWWSDPRPGWTRLPANRVVMQCRFSQISATDFHDISASCTAGHIVAEATLPILRSLAWVEWQLRCWWVGLVNLPNAWKWSWKMPVALQVWHGWLSCCLEHWTPKQHCHMLCFGSQAYEELNSLVYLKQVSKRWILRKSSWAMLPMPMPSIVHLLHVALVRQQSKATKTSRWSWVSWVE